MIGKISASQLSQVLGALSVPGHPINLDYSRERTYCI